MFKPYAGGPSAWDGRGDPNRYQAPPGPLPQPPEPTPPHVKILPVIKVRFRHNGAEALINRNDFKADKHERLDAQPAPQDTRPKPQNAVPKKEA